MVLLISLVPGLAASIDDRENDKSSLWDRENLNAAALRMVEARPLLGFGWGRFTDVSPPYFWQAEDRPLTAVGVQSCDSHSGLRRDDDRGSKPQCTVPVHNAYLSNAAELGLVGVTLWIAASVASIGGAIVRRGPPWALSWRIGLFAMAIMWGVVVFFTPLEGPFSPVVLWTWAGIVWASGLPLVASRFRWAPVSPPHSPTQSRSLVGVSPGAALERTAELFEALEIVFPVRFEPRASGDMRGLDGALILGDSAEPPACRCLIAGPGHPSRKRPIVNKRGSASLRVRRWTLACAARCSTTPARRA